MTDDGTDSIVGRIRRTVTGPSDEELAERLEAKADESPGEVDEDDVDDIAALLGRDDEAVVGLALGAAASLAEERPSSAATLAPEVVETLSNRPAEEWGETTLGEADRAFMNDLLAGSVLLELAEADPDHLSPVVDDLAALMAADGRLEPHTLFALARVAAEDRAVDVPRTALVEPIARTLRSSVEEEAETDGELGSGLSLTVAPRETQVELLGKLGDPEGLDALRYAEEHTANEELAAAAADAIDSIADSE
ncbi:hypothetical protein [Halosimplex halobium]|uniref:hypothetical protein n=1 Tax=Halosimplex halobium TaxID=3396618 RepID=UPI003F57EB6B